MFCADYVSREMQVIIVSWSQSQEENNKTKRKMRLKEKGWTKRKAKERKTSENGNRDIKLLIVCILYPKFGDEPGV